MRIIEKGHIYDLDTFDGLVIDEAGAPNRVRLTFVNREQGTEHGGTQTQEVIRALINRTQHCDGCQRWPGNDQIVHHLRMALLLHEARAMEQHTVLGSLKPELLPVGADGHFMLVDYPCHTKAKAFWCDRDGPGGFMGHTCR